MQQLALRIKEAKTENIGESKSKPLGAMTAVVGNLELSCTPLLRTLVGHFTPLLWPLLTTPLWQRPTLSKLGLLTYFPLAAA